MGVIPQISVVVPIYNVQKYLKRCLGSLAAQDFDDFEVLMIDDGSPDNSATIAKQFATSDPRFIYVYQENAGLGAARNKGLALARGALIMWMDSDDFLLQGCLKKSVSLMNSRADDYVTFGVLRYQERAKRMTLSSLHQLVHQTDRQSVSPAACPHIFRDSTAWNKVFRKSFFEENVGQWEEGVLYEDLFPVCRAITSAKSVSVISEKFYVWRNRHAKTSITQNRADVKGLEDRFLALSSIARHLQSKPESLMYSFIEKFFAIDLPIYAAQLGNNGIEYDTAFLRLLRRFLLETKFDFSSSRNATPEQKAFCQHIASTLESDLETISPLDWQKLTNTYFGPRKIHIETSLPQVAKPAYVYREYDYPLLCKVQTIEVEDGVITVSYSSTGIPSENPRALDQEHAVILSLEKSQLEQGLRPMMVRSEKSMV